MKNFFRTIFLPVALEYAALFAGCLLISLSFNLFLCPNKIASGGIPGLSVVLNKLLGLNTAYIQWGINLPIFIIGILRHGSGFGLKTAVGSFTIPMLVLVTQKFPVISNDLLLASVVGGIGVGIGLCLIFRSKGSVGGFSLVALLLHDRTRMKLSHLIMLLNGAVILMAGLSFGCGGAFYALLSLVATGFSIDAANFIFKLISKLKTKGVRDAK